MRRASIVGSCIGGLALSCARPDPPVAQRVTIRGGDAPGHLGAKASYTSEALCTRSRTAGHRVAEEAFVAANLDTDAGAGIMGLFSSAQALGRCLPTPGGVWTIELEAIHLPKDDEVAWPSIRWLFVHYARDGSRAAFEPDGEVSPGAPPEMNCCAQAWSTQTEDLGTFDFDGDGEPELLARVHKEGSEHYDVSNPYIVTFDVRAQKARAFVDAGKSELIVDVDGDGRPDLARDEEVGCRGEYSPLGYCDDPLLRRYFRKSLPGGAFAPEAPYP